MNGRAVAVVVVVVAAAATRPGVHASPVTAVAVRHPAPALHPRPARHHQTPADKAIAYARAQLGKPYVYGGAGRRQATAATPRATSTRTPSRLT